MINIVICIFLSFLYCLTQHLIKCFKIKVLTENHVYIWSFIVIMLSLIYSDSLIRNASFNVLNYHVLKDIALPVVASVIIARFSGYISGNRKYNINFIIVFPIIEEILFRGIILQLLLHVSFLGETASCVFCGVLFGIMHFQYFGFNKEAAKKVIIAFLGGYYFSIIAVSYGSIIPVIILHIVFNLSAVLFDKNIKHAK